MIEKAVKDPLMYPLTIISDRYGGVYSGGNFTAWNCDAADVPVEIDSSDVECEMFWSNFDEVVGRGNTPDEAFLDLYRQLTDR